LHIQVEVLFFVSSNAIALEVLADDCQNS